MQTQKRSLTSRELGLLVGAVALLLFAALAPAIYQAANHHDFADKRVLLGVPFALDTLSNLPFLLFGSLGLYALYRKGDASDKANHSVFFAGLVLTAIGSAWYHLKPNDAGLAVDRFAMAVSFAGIISLAIAERVSERASSATLTLLLALAPSAVGIWAFTGNVMPWAVVQFGGLFGLCWLATLKPLDESKSTVAWWQVIVIYALAKACEHLDLDVFHLSAEWVSGHTLKHLLASLSALPLLASLRQKRQI